MRPPPIWTCRTLLATLAAVCAVEASRFCGETDCGEQQRCCVPGTGTANGNGNRIGHGNGSAEESGGGGGGGGGGCCRLPVSRTFLDNVGWLTRKLSGLLILLLLFAVGYFIQRIVCPRPRHRHNHNRGRGDGTDEPSSTSLFHSRTTASQDSLLDRFQDCGGFGEFTSPVLQLPAYDEVKYLPTYEETMQGEQGEEEQGHRNRDRDRGTDAASGPGETLQSGQERGSSRSSRNSV